MTGSKTDSTTLTVRVESAESFFEDALDRVLNPKNLDLLRTTLNREPASVRELARLVERDVKNVSTAVNELAELGVVDLETTGRANRPVVRYDEIEVRYSLRNPDADSAGRTTDTP